MPKVVIIVSDNTIGPVVENDNVQKAKYLKALNNLINSEAFQFYSNQMKQCVIGEQIKMYKDLKKAIS